MTPELKEKWAAALESGEYEQAQGKLRDHDDRMCCLGVLCHLVDQSRWKRFNPASAWLHLGEEGIPRLDFLLNLGISSETAEGLAEQNDAGVTFREIAKLVRDLPDDA